MSTLVMQNTLVPPCVGMFGRIFGHHFQPRFSVIEEIHPPQDEITKAAIEKCNTDTFLSSILDSAANLNKSRDSTYMGEVCVRCGLTITVEEHARNLSPT